MSPIAKKFSLWEKDLIALQSKATNWDNVLPEVHEVQVFYAKLELLEARLTNTREEYFATASDEDIAKNEDSLITWENSLYNLQVKCTKFKNRCEQAATSRNKETPFKLEKLSISEFNGKFSEWRDFYGTFTTAVADNTYLKESEKLVYLRKALIGEAKSIVSNFDTNETSFASAWALVKKRYSNPREIIFAHIRTFDEMKHVQESSAGIRKLVDGINELTRSLTSLGVPVNHWDLIIIYYALKKLDSTSKREWLLSLSSNDPPKLEPFVNFLERRASAFADSNFHIKSNQPSKPQPPNQSSFKSKSYTSAHAESSTSSCKSKSCLACEGDHYLFQCKTFSSYPVSDRNKFVRDHHLCLNCMFRGHTYLSCPTNFACKLCQKKHHTLLHEERKQKPNSSQSSNMPVYLPVSSSNSHKSSAHISSESEVNVISNQCIPTQSFNHIVAILETALVYVKDFKGTNQLCRAFLDNGSESNFITESCIARLGLARKKTCANVGGIGGIQAVIINGISSVDITSRVQDYSINLNVLIIPKLTGSNLPRTSIKSDHAYLNKLCLADPGYATPSQVDILIGTRSLGKLKLPGLIIGPPGCPDAQNSVFGWIISGESCSTSSSHLSFELSTHHTNCTPFEPCLDLRIKKFWEIEEVEQSLSLTSEDKLCEEIFKCTTIKEPSGRYAVTLPFKPDAPQLGNSRIQAIKRFYNLEKNLSKNLDIYESYTDQMQSNLDNNIMEEVPTLEIDNPLSYYMPHHIVTKLKSSSTRHRIVFDASAKTSNGLSLNNVLMTGPKIQTDLIPLLIHFRTHLVAFSADIVKFYNQFVVSHPHSDFQRFIWRKSPEDTLKDYRMNRVTFGVTTAPYLAIRCLHELADEHRETHPLVYHILKEQFLVDNLLSGAQNIDEAKEIQTQLIEVLSKPLLKLRKWSSNYPQVIQSIPAEDREMIFPCNVATDNSIKTIGLLWSPISDTISIKLPEYSNQSTTKRELLSSIAKVFDPLGFLSPVTVRPKVILQQLWKEKLDWDTKIPNYIQEQWDTYIQDLDILCKFTINRCLTKSSSSCNSEHPPIYEIYGFSDASNTAYSAVVYLKTTGIPGSSSSELIMAKTKVAPLKNESIPRLELCGAALLVKIIPGIIEAMKIPILSIRCFSDSSCVLGWISSAKKQEVFVQNRINKINHDLPGAVWGYVSTKENPADVASRGISAKKLLCDPLWLHGPPWILTNEIMVNISTEIDSSFSTFNEKILEIINKTSSFNSMKRKVAYFIRFINNLNRSSPKNYGPFTVAEFRQSIIILVKAVQEEVYHKEINLCKKNKTHLTTIKSMTPFLDHQSVLRVGGRLRNSFLTYDQQHPILLPKKHHFTIVIGRHFHLINQHPGPQLLLALIRDKFWIPRGIEFCSKIVKNCVRCHQFNPQPLRQIMGQLPVDRVNISRPFTKVGVDYAGPFFLNSVGGRNPKITKGYVCVFVCLVVKAVHLEYAGDLSTEAFIAALKRFVSRRGLPAKILCDGGTNFLGAKNEMKEFKQFISSYSHQNQISKYFVDQGIEYVVNPPHSPHHGGIFEAAVKSMKYHLVRVIGERRLTIEEFITLLAEIEATLNSRPITPLSTDSNDFNFLSPAHFLVGGSLKAIPQKNLMDAKLWSLSRWQMMQYISQQFFKQWSTQYIQGLQKSSKWYQQHPNVGVGTMVLLNNSDSSIGPQKWTLGRISKIHPGADSLVRVVDVQVPVLCNITKSKTGVKLVTYTRPITKISPLPMDGDLDER